MSDYTLIRPGRMPMGRIVHWVKGLETLCGMNDRYHPAELVQAVVTCKRCAKLVGDYENDPRYTVAKTGREARHE